jgi:membrane glycosyltransferase
VLTRANELARTARQPDGNPLRELREDAGLLRAHLDNLPAETGRVRGRVDPHVAIARAKIEDATTFDEALEFLSPRETFAALNSPAVLKVLLELPVAEGERHSAT